MGEGMTTGSGDISVSGLLGLAREKSGVTKRTYAALGAALINGDTADVTLTDRQRSVLSQLLRQVTGDIFTSLRWLILANLEDDADASRDPWSSIGTESEARVYALLSRRGQLRDTALIEAVVHRLYQHQVEQAIRPPDHNRWTNEPTLDNPSEFFDQAIPEFSPVHRRLAAHVIDRSRRTDPYGNPVLPPGEIDPVLYESLHWRVAAMVRQMLMEDHGASVGRHDGRLEAATAETIRHAMAIASAPTSTAEAVRALETADLLTIDTVNRLLRAGEITLFEEAFARLAGIRPVLIRRLLYETGGTCFAVLARALHMELEMARSFLALTRPGNAAQFGLPADGAASLEAVYDNLSVEDANLVRSHWTRHPAFLSALMEAEPNPGARARNMLH